MQPMLMLFYDKYVKNYTSEQFSFWSEIKQPLEDPERGKGIPFWWRENTKDN